MEGCFVNTRTERSSVSSPASRESRLAATWGIWDDFEVRAEWTDSVDSVGSSVEAEGRRADARYRPRVRA